MSAFLIATVTVKDAKKFQEYGGKAMETIQAFNGELMLRGKYEGVLAGNTNHQAAAIIKFPDIETLNNWYQSDEYQAIIPLRDEAADVIIVKYEQPE